MKVYRVTADVAFALAGDGEVQWRKECSTPLSEGQAFTLADNLLQQSHHVGGIGNIRIEVADLIWQPLNDEGSEVVYAGDDE